MLISKPKFYNLTCPHCGTEISLSYDEFMGYVKRMNDEYRDCTVLCQKEGVGDFEYYNFDCPSCHGYIPVFASDMESDSHGFCPSKCLNVVMPAVPTEISMDDYFEQLNEYEESLYCDKNED